MLWFFSAFGLGFDVGFSCTCMAVGEGIAKNWAAANLYSRIAVFGYSGAFLGMGSKGNIAWFQFVNNALAGGLTMDLKTIIDSSAAAEQEPGGGFATAAIMANCVNGAMLIGMIATVGADC